jgi:hypothetical protein
MYSGSKENLFVEIVFMDEICEITFRMFNRCFTSILEYVTIIYFDILVNFSFVIIP